VPFTLSPNKWRFLRFLSLSDNGLSALSEEALAPLQSLSFLDLSRNRFTTLPKALATCGHLRSLDISGNLIDNLRTLLVHPIPGIATLNLRQNKLADLCGIERLPSIERLDLRDNLLRDPAECARLVQAPGLSDLYVAGNPFAQLQDVRITIFNLLRQNPVAPDQGDIALDGKRPGMLEKRSLVPRAAEVVAPNVAVQEADKATAATLQVKKRVHRSRQVDLKVPIEDASAESSPATSPRQVKTSAAAATTTSGTRTTSYSAETTEAYRRKIEQLKQEVGPGWLRVMNDAQVGEQARARPVSVNQD
jgi:Leucine-rich repeat (LRR) protein